jgi:NAD(P)-dependent dehydrogenase (short-subunit alcohol dehydrogenase family)
VSDPRRVVVVTGGGGGIGAAIAEELGRTGAMVVTVDPLVSVDGSERLPPPERTTAQRIVDAGGAARASSVSVTDQAGITELFDGLVAEFGSLDAVVNVAGISRPTGFATGSEDDWADVLTVHLDGYLTILGAALPIMATAGRGHILGVTSGSGWRAANTGAYGCAKRAVASLTWQLGRSAPPGVVVNALSPIAATRMVTAALAKAGAAARRPSGTAATGGLSLGTMPEPEQLGPVGAHLVGGGFDACRGQVLFAGGSEVAVISPPALLEVVRTGGVGSLASVLDAVGPAALVSAEANQASSGGSNPRFGPIFGDSTTAEVVVAAPGRRCAVAVADRGLADTVTRSLEARGVVCVGVALEEAAGFAGPKAALDAAATDSGPLDALVVAPAPGVPGVGDGGWESLLAGHAGIVGQLFTDAAWSRAAADHAAEADRPLRLVTLVDAFTAGGRSRAQAAAQLARSATGATDGRVHAFAVSVETTALADHGAIGELAAHLVAHPDATGLSGAELVVGAGWLGTRSHPRPSASVTFGGPDLPSWFDDVVAQIVSQGARS